MTDFAGRKKAYMLLMAAILVFNVWLAWQIPYTHDDWDWGLPIGIRHLLTADINSRYTGNLIEVLLTRSVLLKTVVMGVVLTLIPASCTRFVVFCLDPGGEGKVPEAVRAGAFLFAYFILLSLPSDIWRQTNGWVAGFSNFVVSGLALVHFSYLIAVRAMRPAPRRTRGRSAAECLLLALFGLVIQLFLENLTVFFFLCALLFFLYCLKKDRGSLPAAASLLAGTALGLAVMFSSSIYGTLWDTGYAIGTYRQLMYDKSQPLYVFLFQSCYRYLKDFIPMTVGHHGLLAASVSLLLLLSAQRGLRGRPVLRGLACLGDAAFAAYYVYSYFRGVPVGRLLQVAIDLAFALFITVEIGLCFSGRKRLLLFLYTLWLSPFIIMAPMVVINTVGPRSYYTTTVCLIVFCQVLLVSWLLDGKKAARSAVLWGCAALSLACAVHLAAVYYPIGAVSRQRGEIIRGAGDAEGSVTIPRYPNARYLWYPDPNSEERVEYFRAFYGIPQGTDLIFESENG